MMNILKYVILLLSLLLIPFPWQSFLWSASNDFAHVVLFALLAIVLVLILRNLFIDRPFPHRKSYALAGMGILVLAVSSEMVQVFTSTRNPSVGDLIRDLIGGGCGLAWFATVDRQGRGWSRWPAIARWAVSGLRFTTPCHGTAWKHWPNSCSRSAAVSG